MTEPQYSLPTEQSALQARGQNLDVFKWTEHDQPQQWVKGINKCIDLMNAFNEKFPAHQFKISQIKEKFGMLRFYYTSPRDVPPEAKEFYDDIVDSVQHTIANSEFLCAGKNCDSIEGEMFLVGGSCWTILCKSCQEKQ